MDAPLRDLPGLRRRLHDAGALPVHSRRVLTNWAGGRSIDRPPGARRPRYPRSLVEVLPAIGAELDGVATEARREGDRRLLRLRSGRTVECVDLPRDGLCVSTQVGCAVGCRFCRTGEDGLLEQMGSLEILAQVVITRRERRVRRVVFMGMGEPAHNLDAVLEAIDFLADEGGFGHEDLVFSTVGSLEVIERLAGRRVRPALALSLHTLDATLRQELLPRAARVAPDQLLQAGLDYADRTHQALLVQWTLLDGVNDDPDQARALAERLRGRRAIVNFIPFNAVEGNGFDRPPIERCVEMVREVRRAGALATLRMSAAQEVEGGCGQLRARGVREGTEDEVRRR